MKILVTGANGLLGQKLVFLLSENKSVDLYATSRGASRIDNMPANCSYHALDLTDRDGVLRLVSDIGPDCIIHTAGLTLVDVCETYPEQSDLHNVTVVKNLIEACHAVDCHLVHLSTDFIFSGEDGPYREGDTPRPVNYYGECKLRAEGLVKASGLKWAIARTILVYGLAPGMSRSNIVLWVKKSLEEGKEIKVVTDQLRTPTLAEDLAEGCVLIAQQGATGVYHLGGADALTPYEVATRTARFFGLPEELVQKADSSTFTQPAKRPPRTGLVIEKARTELGYEPGSFEEGLTVLSKQLEA